MERSDLAKFDLPDAPGVYLFKRGRTVLYVGKATSLKDRARSYFDDDLVATRGPRVVDMVTKADRLTYETTPTVLEALVREAALIKKYHPSANAEGKDDSTFLYAAITREDIPRVLTLRGKDIDFKNRMSLLRQGDALTHGDVLRAIYGPFPSGAQLHEGLRLIRRIFPFFDTPKPIGARSKHQATKLEFGRQISQYPRKINKQDYRRTIHHIMTLLSGQGKRLRVTLEKEMKRAAEEERFEDAARVRRELFALDHIQDVSLIKDENTYHTYQKNATVGAKFGYRIEAYDVAHLGGTNAIGVMTVVRDGEPSKRDYRTFRIRGSTSSPQAESRERKKLNDDIASLKEILSRRLGHPEWPLPQAIVVDGGKAHKKAAESVLAAAGVSIPVAAVVKDERHRPREVIGARRAGVSEAAAVLVNSEAHRFSLLHHRRARSQVLKQPSLPAGRQGRARSARM